MYSHSPHRPLYFSKARSDSKSSDVCQISPNFRFFTFPATTGKYEHGWTFPFESMKQIDWAQMHPLPPPVENVRDRGWNFSPSSFIFWRRTR